MANQSSGCSGCLGSLFTLAFIGSIFFGGGVLMRVGGLQFSLGNPVDQRQLMMNYMSDLEVKQEIAVGAVQKIHRQLDQGKCREIYEQANEMFRSSQSAAEIDNVCAVIKREFGTVKSAQQIDWWGQLAEQEEDTYILTRYNTQFSKSSVQEIFIWLIKGEKAELISYEFISYQVNPLTDSPRMSET